MAGELLSLNGVCKSYRRGARSLRVLVDVMLTVGEREIVGVVGPRDVGKTTLLEIAAGLQKPDRGEVWLAGVELVSCSDRERDEVLRRDVAWVRRGGMALDCGMLEYISLALMVSHRHNRRDAEGLAMLALERVGAERCAGLRWNALSNWERVLVGFALGMAREPRLLVVDDVIDGFGMSRTREAGELLLSFVEKIGCSVLMSASDFEPALIADRLLSFEHGKLKLPKNETLTDEAEIIELTGTRQYRQQNTNRHT